MRIKKVAGPNQTKTCPRCGRELPLESYCKGNGMYGKEVFVRSVTMNYIILMNRGREED